LAEFDIQLIASNMGEKGKEEEVKILVSLAANNYKASYKNFSLIDISKV